MANGARMHGTVVTVRSTVQMMVPARSLGLIPEPLPVST